MPLTKIAKLFEIIRFNGGIIRSAYKLYIQDELKEGRLVGKDEYGNTYYENNRYFMGRNRWVEFNPVYQLEYDASHIPPEWYGWMHNTTDLLPCEDPSRKFHKWMLPHTENVTGTHYQYYPYSTTIPKVIPWNPAAPCAKKKKPCSQDEDSMSSSDDD